MHRFFVEPEQIIGANAVIAGNDAHHIADVLRLVPGEPIVVCDGEGYEYQGDIVKCGRDEVTARITLVLKSQAEPPARVILAQGVPKKAEALELVIQKATELGVSRLVPLVTERTVARPKEDKLKNRWTRWNRIALEAAKQCRRAKVPVVDLPMTLGEFLDSIPRDALCIIPYEMEKSVGIREVLQWELEKHYSRTVVILIGPEGGFSAREVDEARRSGAVPVSMGPRILRTETAGITALGIVLYELGDLGGAAGA